MFRFFSLRQKFYLACLPIFVGLSFVAYSIYNSNAERDPKGEMALRASELVSKAEIAMLSMSEHMLKYFLNPQDKGEFKLKKEADENYSKYSEELSALFKDDPEVAALVTKMKEFDETTLDPSEDEAMKLVAEESPEAKTFFQEKYLPARQLQNGNFRELGALVGLRSQAMLEEMHKRKMSNAFFAISLLVGSTLLGLGTLLIVMIGTTKSIDRVVQTIRESTASVYESSNGVAKSSLLLSEAASAGAESVAQTVASVEDLTSIVVKNSENASHAAVKSTDAEHEVGAGKEAVDQVNQSMFEINETTKVLNQLMENNQSEMSEIVRLIREIDSKTRVINEIVFQTKLLSFNASVEAARAGDSGKGFAVVADEVGKLAEMSGASSKQISELLNRSITRVGQILDDTKSKMTKATEQSQKKIEEGLQVAEVCSRHLDKIVGHVTDVTSMAREISSASREQSNGIAEINKAMNQLDNVTRQNASTSETIAQDSKTLISDADKLKLVVTELVEVIGGASAVRKITSIETRPSDMHESENSFPVSKKSNRDMFQAS